MKAYQTIKELVIDAYNSEGTMPSSEKLTALVKQYFPKSKWKKTHYAWYKSQIKTGQISVGIEQAQNNESDLIENEVEDSIEARASIERDLHDYLSQHLNQIDPTLALHAGGVEYQTEAGRVDILAVDKDKNRVVIEIKAGKAKDSSLGQLLGYMGCLTTEKKSVRGILVASEFDPRVVFACRGLPNIRLVKYSLNFSFKGIS